MQSSDALERGRAAIEREAWGEARSLLAEADRVTPLDPDDLEHLAIAGFLAGDDAQAIEALSRAYQAHLSARELRRATKCAFWLNFIFDNRGEAVRARGWQTRAEELIDECGDDCVERGYVRMIQAFVPLEHGDIQAAHDAFAEVAQIGQRFGDPDLRMLGTMGRGKMLTLLGRREEGFALLDEVMTSVIHGEVMPVLMGQAYCMVVETCYDFLELRRATEWTETFRQWCESHPDMAAYRGDCLLYRSEVLQINGAWQDAMEEVSRACVRLADPQGQLGLAGAHYRRGELHRLRGEYNDAEAAYRQASRLGKSPEPGLALLRLNQGQVSAAAAMMRRALAEASDPGTRWRLLPAYIEIMLEAEDLPSARDGVVGLRRLAEEFATAYVDAAASHQEGALALTEGKPSEALPSLRKAVSIWLALPAPYEAARTRSLISRCCRELGDEESAELELDAARVTFQLLGAKADLARIDAATARTNGLPGHLTAREVDVLRLVAAGNTNRAIADELIISEKTVARHMSNIFTKIGVSSRAAATAFAYEHKLV
jgi:DNA-binding CsgD family transcriptional regulator